MILYRHGLLADPQSVREKLTITSDLVSALQGLILYRKMVLNVLK